MAYTIWANLYAAAMTLSERDCPAFRLRVCGKQVVLTQDEIFPPIQLHRSRGSFTRGQSPILRCRGGVC